MPKARGEAHQTVAEARRLFAEAVGTFLLTFVALAGVAVEKTLGIHVGDAAKVVAPGVLVMTMIYTLGEVSGAHLNPAVTFAFALRGDFPWKRVPSYIIVQFIGAVVAAVAMRAILHPPDTAFHAELSAGAAAAFAMEIVLTSALVLVILGTGEQASLVGPNAAIAVGGIIAVDGLIGVHVSGASMNPARSLGPLMVAGGSETWWIFLAGPLIGASIAVGVTWLCHGAPDREEKEQSRGKGG